MAYERLTVKRHGKNYIKTPLDGMHDFPFISHCVGKCEYTTGEAIKRLAELEDKIESGLLVELPCKVGDDVYYIKDYGFGRKRVERMHVVGFNFGNGNKEITVVGSYGEQAWDIYFTEEAAEFEAVEATLKELKGE